MPEQLSVDADGVAQSPAAAPVATDQRIHTLDILRGLALFGMILVHFHQHVRREVTGVEDLIGWGVWIFAEQKAWGTFAFLFGVGFAVLLRRLDARGEAATSIYLRRLVALAAFGVVAEVGFGFQILFEYAYWGLALLLIRRLSTPKLLTVAVASACAAPMIAATSALYAWWTAATSKEGTAQNLLRSATDAAQSSSYSTLLAARWAVFVYALPHDWRAVVPTMSFTLFVLGMLALRLGVLENPRRHLRLIKSFMMFGALSWAASWVFTLFLQPHLPTIPIPGLAWPLLACWESCRTNGSASLISEPWCYCSPIDRSGSRGFRFSGWPVEWRSRTTWCRSRRSTCSRPATASA